MSYELRQPIDYKFGTISAGITALDTTVQSAAFTSLPSTPSTTQYLPVELADDSQGINEIVWVTGHTANSTSVTVIRAREGTTARAWSSGAVWRIAPTVRDFLPVLTRATLPSDPHIGMRALLSDESIVVEKVTNGWMPTQRPMVHAGLTTGFVAVGAGIVVPITQQINTHPGTYFTVSGNAVTIVKAGTYRVSHHLYASGGSGYQAVQNVSLNTTGAGGAVSGVMLWKQDVNDYAAGNTVTRTFVAGDVLRIYQTHSSSAGSAWGTDGYQGCFLEVEMVTP